MQAFGNRAREKRRSAAGTPRACPFFLPARGGRKAAFSATKAVGHAVCRHRHVRKLREFYRLNKSLFPEAGHFLFLLRSPVDNWQDFEARLKSIISGLDARQP